MSQAKNDNSVSAQPTATYDKSKFNFTTYQYGGGYTHGSSVDLDNVKTVVNGKIKDGIAKLKAEPETFSAIQYQSNMDTWPEDQ